MDIVPYSEKLKNFLMDLSLDTQAKVRRMLALLQTRGHLLRMPYSRHLTSGIFELRIHGSEETRILYAFRQGTAVLLHGFIKKTEATPTREIERAMERLRAFDEI